MEVTGSRAEDASSLDLNSNNSSIICADLKDFPVCVVLLNPLVLLMLLCRIESGRIWIEFKVPIEARTEYLGLELVVGFNFSSNEWPCCGNI